MKKRASAQKLHVSLEAIAEGLVRLRGGEYRAVLEVSGVNFGLLGEGEQEALLAGYAAFLNGLTFPVQILVRVLPLDMEVYLAHLGRRVRAGLPNGLLLLLRDHEAFLRRLARNRTLLQRRFYVVVPAEAAPATAPRLLPLGRRRDIREDGAMQRQLTFRCEEVARQLGRCGLTARRLGSTELAQLYYACWCPDLSRLQRLERDLADYTGPALQGGDRREGRTG